MEEDKPNKRKLFSISVTEKTRVDIEEFKIKHADKIRIFANTNPTEVITLQETMAYIIEYIIPDYEALKFFEELRKQAETNKNPTTEKTETDTQIEDNI